MHLESILENRNGTTGERRHKAAEHRVTHWIMPEEWPHRHAELHKGELTHTPVRWLTRGIKGASVPTALLLSFHAVLEHSQPVVCATLTYLDEGGRAYRPASALLGEEPREDVQTSSTQDTSILVADLLRWGNTAAHTSRTRGHAGPTSQEAGPATEAGPAADVVTARAAAIAPAGSATMLHVDAGAQMATGLRSGHLRRMPPTVDEQGVALALASAEPLFNRPPDTTHSGTHFPGPLWVDDQPREARELWTSWILDRMIRVIAAGRIHIGGFEDVPAEWQRHAPVLRDALEAGNRAGTVAQVRAMVAMRPLDVVAKPLLHVGLQLRQLKRAWFDSYFVDRSEP